MLHTKMLRRHRAEWVRWGIHSSDRFFDCSRRAATLCQSQLNGPDNSFSSADERSFEVWGDGQALPVRHTHASAPEPGTMAITVHVVRRLKASFRLRTSGNPRFRNAPLANSPCAGQISAVHPLTGRRGNCATRRRRPIPNCRGTADGAFR
jgi:hypothetical protein